MAKVHEIYPNGKTSGDMMNAKDFLDYGALGLAGLTMLLNLALSKWVFGKAFSMMSEANRAFQKIGSAVSKKGKNDDQNS